MEIVKLTTSPLDVVPENIKENFGRKRRPRYYPVPPMTFYDSPFMDIRKDFDTASIFAAINTAMKRFNMIKGLHCFYFGFMGQPFTFYDGISDSPQTKTHRLFWIESILYNAKISVPLDKVSMTFISLTNHYLTTKEKMKAMYKTPFQLSLSDDLEDILNHFRTEDFTAIEENQHLFFLPMISLSDSRKAKEKDPKFIDSFFVEDPDVPPDEMVSSASTSKYAHWIGYRVTIPDLNSDRRMEGSGPLRLPLTDHIFDQTKKYSIMMHDDIEDSLIQGRLDIYPLQVDEENLLEMNDKELNDHMKDLVFLNYESVDSYNFTDFYYKKHDIYHEFTAYITGGAVKIVSFNENYLDICS